MTWSEGEDKRRMVVRAVKSAMFFYLSFLRPPPRTVSANAKDVLITPQIANDLRTE